MKMDKIKKSGIWAILRLKGFFFFLIKEFKSCV